MFRLNTLLYLFVLIFQSVNAENMRNVTKMDSANARKAISRKKGNAYGLKVCVSLITVDERPPFYNGHIFGGKSTH